MINKDVFDLYEGLDEITRNKEIKFSAKTSYCLAFNKKILEPYYQTILDIRGKLFEKYGEVTNEGWKVPNENIPAFSKEWQEFTEVDNSINIKQINIQDISDAKIDVDLMIKLLPIIIE